MKTNFTQCAIQWGLSSEAYRSNHTYLGPIAGVISESDRSNLISPSTCKDLCGPGVAYNEPIDVIVTVTTWILPMMGLLLQAPYESNHFWRTIKATLRWLGSPISSITCVLWNIKVLDKCALLVDMAEASSVSDNPHSPSAEIRDSFYILSVMNQFQIRSVLPDDSAAEVLLRIALFSDSLEMIEKRLTLPIRTHGRLTLKTLRENLAKELRSRRRHGSVPVFISLLWFLAALAFSIYFAFGSLGVRATALNLAMGLMLSWIPVFILACIVDRNPYGTERILELLNEFLAHTAESVLARPGSYLSNPEPEDSEIIWLEKLTDHLQEAEKKDASEWFKNFFVAYAGQGRTRWHYGVAHSILADIEDAVVSSSGRGWFSGDSTVRDKIIRGPIINEQLERPTGLHYLSLGEFWQAMCAFLIVEGTLAGAFTLAYCTPTYGLGCRSGGFMIFMTLTFFSFLFEIAFWVDIDRRYKGKGADYVGQPTSESKKTRLNRLKVEWREYVFVALDFTVTGWLCYIVWAQTIGAWETCDCIGTTWGQLVHGPGGYIDFLSVIQYKAHGIARYWLYGTGTSIGVMGVAMGYIVTAWCTQSHLSTEDDKKARKGLERTRQWKSFWFWISRIFSYPLQLFLRSLRKVLRKFPRCNLGKTGQSTKSGYDKKISWEPIIRGDDNDNSGSRLLDKTPNMTSTAV